MLGPIKSILCSVTSVAIWIVGCNDSDHGIDASFDGEPGQEDVGPIEGSQGDSVFEGADWPILEFDLENHLGLLIPENAKACQAFSRTPLEDQLRLKVRVAFLPGFTMLPRDLDEFPGDLIERIELTPGQEIPQSEGPGNFSRTFIPDSSGGTMNYLYEQSFQEGERMMFLSAKFAFDIGADPPLIALDRAGMFGLFSRNPSWLLVSFSDGEELTDYFSCDFGPYRINEYEFNLEDGTTLVLSEWMVEVPMLNRCAAGLVRAVYSQGEIQQEVEDFWRLAYYPGNHNIIEYFALRFEPPIGEIHGLKVYTQSLGFPLAELSSVFPLDASLVTGVKLPIQSAVYRGRPCSAFGLPALAPTGSNRD